MKTAKYVRYSILAAPLLLTAVNAVAENALTYHIGSGGAINDPAEGGGSTQTIFTFNVPHNLTIEDINFRLALDHMSHIEIEAKLRAPGGIKEITLFDGYRTGEVEFRDGIFDDEAAERMDATLSTPDGKTAYTGSFRPLIGSLSEFDGIVATGTWQLIITDSANGDSGNVYAQGENAPWGIAEGTALLITPVPEPSIMMLGLTAFGFVSARYVGRKKK